MCGWNNGIAYKGDDQNTEFDALQITLAQQMLQGSCLTGQLPVGQRVRRAERATTPGTMTVTHGRDSNTRHQQLTVYGSYDLPFGKGKQFAARRQPRHRSDRSAASS